MNHWRKTKHASAPPWRSCIFQNAIGAPNRFRKRCNIYSHFFPRSFFLFNNLFKKIFMKTVVAGWSIGDTRFRSVQFQMVSNRLGKLILQSALSVSGNSPAFPGKRFRCFSDRQLLMYSRLVLPSKDSLLGRPSGFFFVRSQVSPHCDVILFTLLHPSPASIPPSPVPRLGHHGCRI